MRVTGDSLQSAVHGNGAFGLQNGTQYPDLLRRQYFLRMEPDCVVPSPEGRNSANGPAIFGHPNLGG